MSLSASRAETEAHAATMTVVTTAVHVVTTTEAHAATTEALEVHVVTAATHLKLQSRTTNQRCSK